MLVPGFITCTSLWIGYMDYNHDCHSEYAETIIALYDYFTNLLQVNFYSNAFAGDGVPQCQWMLMVAQADTTLNDSSIAVLYLQALILNSTSLIFLKEYLWQSSRPIMAPPKLEKNVDWSAIIYFTLSHFIMWLLQCNIIWVQGLINSQNAVVYFLHILKLREL